MKLAILFGLGVLTFSLSAYADKRPDWKLDCVFSGSGAKKGADQCRARLRLCNLTDDHKDPLMAEPVPPGAPDETPPEAPAPKPIPTQTAIPTRDYCSDELAVECNGQLLFSGEASHDSFRHFEVISGVQSLAFPLPPTVKLAADDLPHKDRDHSTMDRGDRDDDEFFVSAWLKVNTSELTGVCQVNKKRDRRRGPPAFDEE